MDAIPLIDIGTLVAKRAGQSTVAEEIGRACRDVGFFYVVGHGVDERLSARLEELSREFFALPFERKTAIINRFVGYV